MSLPSWFSPDLRTRIFFSSGLSNGHLLSVKQAAQDLSITYETARTPLRRIFSKTDTSRQAELLLVMARLPAIKNDNTHG